MGVGKVLQPLLSIFCSFVFSCTAPTQQDTYKASVRAQKNRRDFSFYKNRRKELLLKLLPLVFQLLQVHIHKALFGGDPDLLPPQLFSVVSQWAAYKYQKKGVI